MDMVKRPVAVGFVGEEEGVGGGRGFLGSGAALWGHVITHLSKAIDRQHQEWP